MRVKGLERIEDIILAYYNAKKQPLGLLFRLSYCKDAAIFVRFSSIRSKYVLLSSLLSIV